MKVTYVGNFEPEFSTENDVREAFEYLGWDVVRVQENRTRWDDLRSATLNSDLLLWTSTWDNAQPLEESRQTFALCEQRGIPTATYHLDVFHGVSRGGRNVWANPMMHTHHVFTADGDNEGDFAERGINHHWLRPGVRHTACHPGIPRASYVCDVAFVGSDGKGYHPEWGYRRRLVDWLEETCKRRGWTFRNPGGREAKIPRGEEMNDFYASARVTVGDSLCLKKEKARYWSDRAYEAPGRGGLLVMPYIDELNNDYDGELPMYPWGEFDKLEAIIAHYLTEPRYRTETRTKTWEIVTASHTYVRRVQRILEVVM